MKPRFRALFRAPGSHRHALRTAEARGHRKPQKRARLHRVANGEAIWCSRPSGISAIYVAGGGESARDERTHVVLRDGKTRIERRVYRANPESHAQHRSNDRAGRPRKATGIGWRAAAVAVIAGCILSTSARAESFFQVESGIGGSAYSDGGDGYWYQEGFEHKLRLTAPAIEAGVTGDIYQAAHWGVSYHLDWAWLGAIHTQSLATPQDSTYNLATKRCNGPCGNIANFAGAGHEQGFLLTVEPHYDAGKWRFGIEAGPFLHHASWSETVTGWSPAPTSPMRSNFTVNSTAGWRIGAVIGAEVSRGPLSIVYQHFFLRASGTDAVPPIWHSVDMLFARYKF